MNHLPPPTPLHWREALANLPVMLILLLGGLASGHGLQGTMAAGAALTVGCAAGLSTGQARLCTMGWATLATTAATIAGICLAPHGATFTGGMIGASMVCALAFVCAPRIWWVLQQAVIFYLFAGFHPSWHDAGAVLAVLLGGLVQLGFSALTAWILPGGSASSATPRSVPTRDSPQWPAGLAYAAYTLLAVGICLALARWLPIGHAYWAPMTALLILRPGWQVTRHRAVERLAGTLLGVAIATLVAWASGEAQGILLCTAILCASLAIALQKAPYAYLCTAITAAVTLLLSLGGVPVLESSLDRLLASLAGGLVVVALELMRSACLAGWHRGSGR